MKLILQGPFTDDDLADLSATFRMIDDRNPQALFRMQIVDAGASMEEAEAKLQSMLPPLPYRATEFARAAYRDDSYQERDCDHCGKPFRGPAIYCSLECAVADA